MYKRQEYTQGILRQRIWTEKEADKVCWQLTDEAGGCVASGEEEVRDGYVQCEAKIEHVKSWSAETPVLYELSAKLMRNHEVQDEVVLKTGFRKIEIQGCNFLVNGKPILLSGVNMHDFSPTGGGTVDKAVVEEDMRLMKQHNINAIRCSCLLYTSRCV